MSDLRKEVAQVALAWVEDWQVDPRDLELTFDYLTNLEERMIDELVELADFQNFEVPVVVVCSAILALCDAVGVERFDSYEALINEV
jgi:hypothetical protein